MNKTELSRSSRPILLSIILTALTLVVLLGMPAQTIAQSQWTTNGNNINNTNPGNVGVGTTTPAGTLTVNASNTDITNTGGAGTHILLTNPNASGQSVIASFFNGTLQGKWRNDYAGNISYVTGAGSHIFFTGGDYPNGAVRMMITNSGNVGIGTATPLSKFDIWSGTWFGTIDGANLSVTDSSSFAQNVGGAISFVGKFNTAGNYTGFARILGVKENATDSNNAGALVFQTKVHYGNQTEYMRISSVGNVGIGTNNPAYRLDVQGGAINASGGLCMAGDCKTSWSQVGGTSQWMTSGSTIYYNSGSIGVGTTTPAAKLNTYDNNVQGSGIRIDNAASSGTYKYGVLVQAGPTAYGLTDWPNATVLEGTASGGLVVSGYEAPIKFQTNLRTTRMTISNNGNVGIGTTSPSTKLHVVGDTTVTGNLNTTGTITGGTIEAKYQDVAEWVPATHALPAGTVVTLNPTQSNQVTASSTAYDTRVAGVISERPGLVLGAAGKDKVLVATTGRVKVKVDASRAPIQIGDLLVTSDKEGVAMKSEPLSLGGTPIHRPGTLIGKALEPLAKGTGEILVLLSLQ